VLHRPEIDLRTILRSCLGRFATGVAVVSLDGDDGPQGLTINSFTSVSLDPPLVLVSIAQTARSHDQLNGRPFVVNVLGAEQEVIARCFAGGARLEIAWEHGELAPRTAGVLAFLECRPWGAYPAGDHTLYLGDVVKFDYRSGDALGYLAGRYVPITEPERGLEYLI
jgi:flavin reductase (DIM6/NTAB) family NADH-FMN oxidoreductase RutF